MVFALNPYDPCVANKDINGKQFTIAWYVDDSKISHVKPEVVTDVIQHIENRFGKMTVTRGKNHTFLGMDITFNKDSTICISMVKHIEDAISSFDMSMNHKPMTPAQKNLFEISEESPLLN
jgi:hypothetical protein